MQEILRETAEEVGEEGNAAVFDGESPELWPPLEIQKPPDITDEERYAIDRGQKLLARLRASSYYTQSGSGDRLGRFGIERYSDKLQQTELIVDGPSRASAALDQALKRRYYPEELWQPRKTARPAGAGGAAGGAAKRTAGGGVERLADREAAAAEARRKRSGSDAQGDAQAALRARGRSDSVPEEWIEQAEEDEEGGDDYRVDHYASDGDESDGGDDDGGAFF